MGSMREQRATSTQTRQQIFDNLRDYPNVTVLIVGGGINGIGVLYDLALQGVDALLIDRGDFCGGTSAASTRIIHGGLRYLENSEFRLVREALKERSRLLRNAPHYVKPLPITIPIFSWTRGLVHGAMQFFRLRNKPGDRGAILIEIGLTLYDAFAGKARLMPRHWFNSRRTALAQRPQLTPDIVCTATYYDARIAYPERLCLELIMDAEAASSNARALNYVSVASAEGSTVTLCDGVTGQTLPVRPKIVVNATGAWIDFTNRTLHRDTQYIGGTKGSHLVIDNRQLWEATRGEMLYFTNSDGRICIFYPFYDKVIAGSTDIPADDPDAAVCDDFETEYILDSVRKVFPTIPIQPSEIVFKFSGVRPLPRMDAATPGQISRDHRCAVIPAGSGLDFPIYSLIGGKWTTYRAFAEQVTDRILQPLGRSRSTQTTNRPIGGGKNYPRTPAERQRWITALQGKTGLAAPRLETLLDRYGTRAEEIATFIAAENDAPLDHAPGYSRREVQYLATCERVIHLEDLVLRRTLLGLLGQVDRAALEELAAVVAPALGWSGPQAQEEIEQTAHLLRSRHGAQKV
jgi:glycerol-3-phosphate dehydrogenase